MGKMSQTELEQLIRDSHKKVMAKKKERELREYIRSLPYNKRTRVKEYMELKDIVWRRHKQEHIDDLTCSHCNHRCHIFAEYGWCNDPECDCKHCLCPRCDLEYNYD